MAKEKRKIVTSYENELLQNFFKELIKFQCRNPAMDVDFENFFKVNTRSAEHLIIDFSFSVRVPNGVVSNRLLRDFFGLDYPLVLRVKNDLRVAMAQSTQSKEHEVTPIKAEFFSSQNEGRLCNRSFCDFIIHSEIRGGLEEYKDPYSTSSMQLWETLKQRLKSSVRQIWNMDVELIRISWKMNPMNIILRLSKPNGENITENQKKQVKDILNEIEFDRLADLNFTAEGRNDTAQVIAGFRSTFQVKMFRSLGCMERHDIMLFVS